MFRKLEWKELKDITIDPSHDYYLRGKKELGKGELWPGQEVIDAYSSQGSHFPADEFLYADAGKPSKKTINKREAEKKQKEDDWNLIIKSVHLDILKKELSPEAVKKRKEKIKEKHKDSDIEDIEHDIILAEEHLNNLKEILREKKK